MPSLPAAKEFCLEDLQKIIAAAGAAAVRNNFPANHLVLRVRAMIQARNGPMIQNHPVIEICRKALEALEKNLPEAIQIVKLDEIEAAGEFKDFEGTDFYRSITTNKSAVLKELAAAVEAAHRAIHFSARRRGRPEMPENESHAWDLGVMLDLAWNEADISAPTESIKHKIVADLLGLAGFSILPASLRKKQPAERPRGRPKKQNN